MSLFNPPRAAQKFQAWVETAANGGNNATARVGDPHSPFATPQAALNAIIALNPGNSLGHIHFGTGTHGTLDLSSNPGSFHLGISGQGYTQTVLQSLLFNPPSDGGIVGSLNLWDLGGQSITIVAINLNPLPATIDTEGFGSNGIPGGTLNGWHLKVDNIESLGGNGANGSAGTGGTAGQGGDVSLNYSSVTNVTLSGGQGGSSITGDFNGGNGGNGGTLTLFRSSCSSFEARNGVGGAGNGSGSAGVDGNSGTLIGQFSMIGNVEMSPNGGGVGGVIFLRFGDINAYSGVVVSEGLATIVNGVFQAGGVLP